MIHNSNNEYELRIEKEQIQEETKQNENKEKIQTISVCLPDKAIM